ncbi:MAG TPA: LiaF domain-containing protein, partial [Actinomycetes bacterium]|nr:LiaF domain-containing protein [Actinomycetes bacterium]
AASGTVTEPGVGEQTPPAWDSRTGGWDRAVTGSPAAGTGPGYGGAPAGWGAAGSQSGWGATRTSVAERRPRQRSVLGWLTVAAALLAAGIASALDNLGMVDLTPTRTVALVLSVIGVGLLVGSVWGRAWWLILLGLLLVPVMVATSVASDVPLRGTSGDQFERPLAAADVQPRYELSGGHLTLDLGQVDFGGQSRDVTVRMGGGELDVIVPKGQPVTVTSSVGAGQVTLLDRPPRGGISASDTVAEPGQRGRGRLTLDLHIGVGQIVVTRGP